MIDTIVFDVGNVLTDWHWRRSFTEMFGADHVEAIADATVRSKAWYELDRGVLNEQEITDLLIQNDPRYAAEITRVVAENHRLISVFPYAAQWARDMKAAGYKLYILSNFSEFGWKKCLPYFDFLPYMDGAVVSYEIKLVKPEPQIYQYLFEKYRIRPENAVFLDDKAENTQAAAALGMKTVTVENKEQAEQALHALGVRW